VAPPATVALAQVATVALAPPATVSTATVAVADAPIGGLVMTAHNGAHSPA